ncbi:MAG: hypothetical protein AAF573_16270, partial [Bacteroidota bacterium]
MLSVRTTVPTRTSGTPTTRYPSYGGVLLSSRRFYGNDLSETWDAFRGKYASIFFALEINRQVYVEFFYTLKNQNANEAKGLFEKIKSESHLDKVNLDAFGHILRSKEAAVELPDLR